MGAYGLWTGQSYYLADTNAGGPMGGDWWLDGSYTDPPALTLRDVVVNSVHTDNFWSGFVGVWGPSDISSGIHVGAFAGFEIDLQRAAGTLDLHGYSSVGYHSNFLVTGQSTLSLDGTLGLYNARSNINVPIAGQGNIVLTGASGTTQFGYGVGSGETIWCLEGMTTFAQPQLIQGTIEGLGEGLILKGDFSYIGNEKLTATDLTFVGFDFRNKTTAFDLHIANTPEHQVVMSLGPDAAGGRQCYIQASGPPIGSASQVVVHQTG